MMQKIYTFLINNNFFGFLSILTICISIIFALYIILRKNRNIDISTKGISVKDSISSDMIQISKSTLKTNFGGVQVMGEQIAECRLKEHNNNLGYAKDLLRILFAEMKEANNIVEQAKDFDLNNSELDNLFLKIKDELLDMLLNMIKNNGFAKKIKNKNDELEKRKELENWEIYRTTKYQSLSSKFKTLLDDNYKIEKIGVDYQTYSIYCLPKMAEIFSKRINEMLNYFRKTALDSLSEQVDCYTNQEYMINSLIGGEKNENISN